MWFKQAQIFKLVSGIPAKAEGLIEQLEPFAFKACLPHFPLTYGWCAAGPETGLVHAVNGRLLLCLQFEEKILPRVVIQQALDKKIKQLEKLRDRKIPQKEKYILKDEIITTLLPQAFSKLSKLHAYIDTQNNWLILNTTHAIRTQQFRELFKKTFPEMPLPEPILPKKIGDKLTLWLTQKEYPNTFCIEKSCVLVDEHQKNRVIRCQQQNLFANAVSSFIKDDCVLKQIALSWQNNIFFTLTEDLNLIGLKFPDKVIEQAREMEPETEQQQFDADFFIMTHLLSGLLKDLLSLFQ